MSQRLSSIHELERGDVPTALRAFLKKMRTKVQKNHFLLKPSHGFNNKFLIVSEKLGSEKFILCFTETIPIIEIGINVKTWISIKDIILFDYFKGNQNKEVVVYSQGEVQIEPAKEHRGPIGMTATGPKSFPYKDNDSYEFIFSQVDLNHLLDVLSVHKEPKPKIKFKYHFDDFTPELIQTSKKPELITEKDVTEHLSKLSKSNL